MATLQRATYHLTNTEEDDIPQFPHIHQRVRVRWSWMIGFWIVVAITILESLILWHKYHDLNGDTQRASVVTNTLLATGTVFLRERMRSCLTFHDIDHPKEVTFNPHPAFHHLKSEDHARVAWRTYNLRIFPLLPPEYKTRH